VIFEGTRKIGVPTTVACLARLSASRSQLGDTDRETGSLKAIQNVGWRALRGAPGVSDLLIAERVGVQDTGVVDRTEGHDFTPDPCPVSVW
jgi:hypothetical protein